MATIPRSVPQDWSADILVVGNSYTGKSALINEMIGREVAEEAPVDIRKKGTIEVQVHPLSIGSRGVSVNFWDTPGLHNGMNVDMDCIKDMKEEGCDNADIMLYCIKMSNTRFQEDDRKAIMSLTAELGEGIWERAVFVLTFASDVVARLKLKHKYRPGEKPVHRLFKDTVSKWKMALSKEVEKAGVDSRVTASIPVVPVGYENEDLLLDVSDNWRESLWNECVVRKRKPKQLSDFIQSGMCCHR